VQGLYPRWDDDPLNPQQVVTGLRSDRREVLVTRFLDGQVDYRSVRPGPSYAPVLFAIACSVAFGGFMYDELMVPIGALLAFAVLTYWHWPGTEERTPPWKKDES
jgi:cytochrome c oxidase subunit 1